MRGSGQYKEMSGMSEIKEGRRKGVRSSTGQPCVNTIKKVTCQTDLHVEVVHEPSNTVVIDKFMHVG